MALPPVRMEEQAFRAITRSHRVEPPVIIKASYDRHGGEANERTQRTFTKVTSPPPRNGSCNMPENFRDRFSAHPAFYSIKRSTQTFAWGTSGAKKGLKPAEGTL